MELAPPDIVQAAGKLWLGLVFLIKKIMLKSHNFPASHKSLTETFKFIIREMKLESNDAIDAGFARAYGPIAIYHVGLIDIYHRSYSLFSQFFLLSYSDFPLTL